jgi:hypothetical protein
MNKLLPIETVHYIETPRCIESPVKINKILEERMKAFLSSRKVRG